MKKELLFQSSSARSLRTTKGPKCAAVAKSKSPVLERSWDNAMERIPSKVPSIAAAQVPE